MIFWWDTKSRPCTKSCPSLECEPRWSGEFQRGSNLVRDVGGTGSRGSIPPMLMLRVRGFVKGFL